MDSGLDRTTATEEQIEQALQESRAGLDQIQARKRLVQTALRDLNNEEHISRMELDRWVVTATSVGMQQKRIAELIGRSREYVRLVMLNTYEQRLHSPNQPE